MSKKKSRKKNPAPNPQVNRAQPNQQSTQAGDPEAISKQIDELNQQLERLKNELADRNKELDRYLKLEGDLQALRSVLENEIKADEARIRQEYREQEEARINELKQQAEKEAERIRRDADEQASKIISDARAEADRLMGEAKLEREIAVRESAKLREEAEREKDRLLESAKRESEELFVQKQRELEERERRITEIEEALRKRESHLENMEKDFQLEKESFEEYRELLERRWKECSPDKVRALENEIEYLKQCLEGDKITIAELQNENAHLREIAAMGEGKSREVIMDELRNAREEIRALRDELANYPSLDEIERLRAESAQLAGLRDECRMLRDRLREAEARASRNELGARELEQAKLEADALRILNESMKKELDYHKRMLESRNGAAFPALKEIDSFDAKDAAKKTAVWRAQRGLDLEKLVDHVVAYAATREPKLYYSETAIRTFIAGLATSKLLILQGLSGTGKTSLPRVFAESISGHSECIAVQPSWRDRYEFLGYYNAFSKRFSETEFTKELYRAGLPSNQDVIWIIILDELNLARVEYYFADFLSVLEEPDPEKWVVPLVPHAPEMLESDRPQGLIDGHKLRVPQNVWFVGTANKDESTFEITDKVYDRAQVLEFTEKHKPFERKSTDPIPLSFTQLQKMLETARQEGPMLTDADWNDIEQLDHYLKDRFGITFGNRVKKQMETFVPVFIVAGGSKDQAVDIQFARKVLRKLERRHEPNLLAKLKELKENIKEIFPNWDMEESIKAIDRKIEDLGGDPS